MFPKFRNAFKLLSRKIVSKRVIFGGICYLVLLRVLTAKRKTDLSKHQAWAAQRIRQFANTELIDRLQNDVPNIPFKFLFENAEINETAPSNCGGTLPRFTDLRINNKVWQHFTLPGSRDEDENGDTSLYLYSAHLDVRPSNPKPAVRIIGTMSMLNLKTKRFPFCHLWFENGSHAVSRVAYLKRIGWKGLHRRREYAVIIQTYRDNRALMNTPCMFNCPLPGGPGDSSRGILKAVSLVRTGNLCEKADNALHVFNGDLFGKTKKDISSRKEKNIAYCVKGLAFPFQDISVRLLEWLEINRALGVDKVFMYYMHLKARTIWALKHHREDLGFLDLTELPLSGDQPNSRDHQYLYFQEKYASHVLHENVAQHDCFYRNMYDFRYITMIDIDEVIVPRGELQTIPELIQKVSEYSPNHDSINLANYYFLTEDKNNRMRNEVPRSFVILHNLYRSFRKSYLQRKALLKTERMFLFSTHGPIYCLHGECHRQLEDTYGKLHHYRMGCSVKVGTNVCQKSRKGMRRDKRLWALKDKVIGNVMDALRSIPGANLASYLQYVEDPQVYKYGTVIKKHGT